MGRDSFLLYKSFYDAWNKIPDDSEKVALINAICEYAMEGRQPKLDGIPGIIFPLIAPQIDSNNKRYENSKKGGAPKGNKNASKQHKAQEKQPSVESENNGEQPNVSVSVSVSDNDSVSVSEDEDAQIQPMDAPRVEPYRPVCCTEPDEFERAHRQFMESKNRRRT